MNAVKGLFTRLIWEGDRQVGDREKMGKSYPVAG